MEAFPFLSINYLLGFLFGRIWRLFVFGLSLFSPAVYI